ncbi:MAG: AAA family ATPase [Minisyncoccales bacterium]
MKKQEIIPKFPEERPKIKDVVGEARNFIDELEVNIEAEGIFKKMGVNPNKTFLLEGLPGTGKTFSINAYNNTKNSNIVNHMKNLKQGEMIGFDEFNTMMFPYDIGKYGTAYINMGSKIVQNFFDTCYAYSELGIKTLVVMDEFDAVGQSRRSSGSRGHNEDKKVLETIMKNLQTSHDKNNMYVVLMTNEPDSCDEAVLRAGRIDQKVKFNLPKPKERDYAFREAIRKVNKNAGYFVIRGIHYDNLVEMSEGFNYADIFQSVENAVKKRAKELYLETGDINKQGRVYRSRLENAVMEHKKSYQPTKKGIGF